MRLVIGREARAQGYPVQVGEETVGGMIEKRSGNWIYFFMIVIILESLLLLFGCGWLWLVVVGGSCLLLVLGGVMRDLYGSVFFKIGLKEKDYFHFWISNLYHLFFETFQFWDEP